MANTSKKLQDAKSAKRDEFYTRLSDIEKELVHYRRQLKGKTILCNCDDPETSNFFTYFVLNLSYLGIKSLITTHYAGPENDSDSAYALTINSKNVDDVLMLGTIDYDALKTLRVPLKHGGDFRSEECINYLQQADIVITNPPFSLFREYMAQLMKYKKQFLIIGNENAITYKEIFPLFQQNKLWFGYNNGHYWFRVPSSYGAKKTDYKVDDEGNTWRRMGNIG